ncbi:MAG: exodeoxyribonuclease VII large subunit [Erysipelotrichia bacterium]|nr:exodeoxyribonuclease VII large subunit [Erysipelotrichia bacterium]NCC55109.1 exodeoxyribonuclease VII large subunit [Erysipelotrichia bacterium]
MKNQVWSISTLVRYLKNSLDNDMNIQSILVKGEISNFTNHRSGHLYFSLKDKGGKMNCVMFSSYASKVKIALKEGMQVIVKAKVSLYEPMGNMQLYVSEIQSDGLGDLYLQFEALKEKLLKAGLFAQSHKKPLPLYPNSIGIISAKSGAAIQDVLAIIARRWPIADVRVYHSLVQGEKASENMIARLKEADQNHHDVILLVRGGGSLEDLWCFNDELLAYTIYEMKTCIVSGVGHESDTTLVDYVSDQRAVTPSGAAELITPDKDKLNEQLWQIKNRLATTIQQKLFNEQKNIERIASKAMFQNSEYFIQNDKLKLMMLVKSLYNAEQYVQSNQFSLAVQKEALFTSIKRIQKENQMHFHRLLSLLDAFSPLKIVGRGYSIAMKEDKVVRTVDDVKENDEISIIVHQGKIVAKVEKREYNDARK